MKVCIYYLIVIDTYNSQLLLSLHYIKRNIQKAQHPTHPLHKLTIHPHTPRLKKNPHSTTSTTPPTYHTQTQSHNNISQQTHQNTHQHSTDTPPTTQP